MKRIRLGSNFVKLLYKFFIDAEASGETARLDDHAIQYSFVASEIVRTLNGKSAKILDVGCTYRFNFLPAILCGMGYDVYGIDNRDFTYYDARFTFTKGDIRKARADKIFDLVYAVTSISHIGVAGRYGEIKKDDKGDFDAIKSIYNLLKDKGVFLFTVPFAPVFSESTLGRIYDWNRINDMLRGYFEVYHAQFCNYKDGIFTVVEESNEANIAMVCCRKLYK